MITFKQLKDPSGTVARSGGLDPQSVDFRQYVNDAVRELMRRGNWWATVQPIVGCVRDRVVTWPRSVGAILALNTCDRPTEVSNHWYQFMPLDPSHVRWAREYDRWGRAGNVMTETTNTACVFNPIVTDGMNLQFYISQPTDAGKFITVYGIDGNGQVIRSKRPDGTFQDGIVLMLANPYVQSPFTIRHVHRIVKDVTDGQVNAYQYSVPGAFSVDLGSYEPTETNPEYITTQIRGHGAPDNWHYKQGNWNRCPGQISALVKLNFIPFFHDNDLVQIDNVDAIRDMLLSIRYREQSNMEQASVYEQSALRELNKQMQDRFPIEQFQVSFRPYGSGLLSKVTRGFI